MSEPPQSPYQKSLRVLVVEDNPDGRESLRALLEALGHTVEVARDGLGGVETGLAWQPQVAVIDIGLPGLNGLEVARRLRAAFGHKVCLIAHTGFGQPADRRRSLEAGFDYHLVKPVDWQNFLADLDGRLAAENFNDFMSVGTNQP
jgi:CheY-like chemotaxis protein